MNAGATIRVPIDFTDANFSGNVMDDLNDVRIVDANHNAEVDRICSSGISADANCFFRLDNNLSANDDARNSAYYIYYGNEAAGAPPIYDYNAAAMTRVHDFEDGIEDLYYSEEGTVDVNKDSPLFGAASINVSGTGSAYLSRNEFWLALDSNYYAYSFWFAALADTQCAIHTTQNGNTITDIKIWDGELQHYSGNEVLGANTVAFTPLEKYWVQFWHITGSSAWSVKIIQHSDNNIMMDANAKTYDTSNGIEVLHFDCYNDVPIYLDNVYGMGSAIESEGFGVAPVSLTVNVPIDESTGVEIDTDAYSYNVEILDINTLTTYTGLTADSTYNIPFGTDYYVIVEVDTNASADYFSRRYALKYEDVNQRTASLQPYLVGASEVSSTFYVRNTASSVRPGVKPIFRMAS